MSVAYWKQLFSATDTDLLYTERFNVPITWNIGRRSLQVEVYFLDMQQEYKNESFSHWQVPIGDTYST